MAKNSDIINAFERGQTKGKVGNLYIEETPKGSVLYNYSTPIAYREKDTGQIYIGDKKYSQTTSRIQNRIMGEKEEPEKFKERLKEDKVYYTGRL